MVRRAERVATLGTTSIVGLAVLLIACGGAVATPTAVPTATPRPEEARYAAAQVLDLLRAGGLTVSGVDDATSNADLARRTLEVKTFSLALAGSPETTGTGSGAVAIFADRHDVPAVQSAFQATSDTHVYTRGNALVAIGKDSPAPIVDAVDRALHDWR